MTMTTSEHAFLAPSAAQIWVPCALYPTMAARFPEQGNKEAAERGEAGHWVGAQLHRRQPVTLGMTAPNGTAVDDQILEMGEVFASSLHGQDWQVEQRLVSKAVHESLNWGTPDAWRFGNHVIDVTDWKGGYEYVEVFENWQLVNYFALIWAQFPPGYDDTKTLVRFRIVQPFAYHKDGPIRTWEVMASDLRPLVNRLRNAAALATSEAPPATPGAHCEYCPGRHACQALERAALSRAAFARRPGVIDILPIEAQAAELAYLEESAVIMNALITGRSQEVRTALAAGARVPGYSLERGEAREQWTRPVSEVAAIGEMIGVKLTKDALITPNQARAAGMPAEIVKQMSERPAGALKLKRVNSEKLASMFGN